MSRANQRKVRPAIVALAAIMFSVFPFSLGLLVYKDSLPAQLSLTLGASIVFAQPHGTLHEGPPHLQPPPTTQTAASTGHSGQNNNSTPIKQLSAKRGHGSQNNKKHGNNGQYNNGQGNGQHGKGQTTGQGKGQGKRSGKGYATEHGHKQNG